MSTWIWLPLCGTEDAELLWKAVQAMRAAADLLTIPDGYESVEISDNLSEVMQDALNTAAQHTLTVMHDLKSEPEFDNKALQAVHDYLKRCPSEEDGIAEFFEGLGETYRYQRVDWSQFLHDEIYMMMFYRRVQPEAAKAFGNVISLAKEHNFIKWKLVEKIILANSGKHPSNPHME